MPKFDSFVNAGLQTLMFSTLHCNHFLSLLSHIQSKLDEQVMLGTSRDKFISDVSCTTTHGYTSVDRPTRS